MLGVLGVQVPLTGAAIEVGRQWECHAAFGLQDSGFFMLSTPDSAMMGLTGTHHYSETPLCPIKKLPNNRLRK